MGYHNLFLSLITITSITSYINYRYIKMPKTIFLTISSVMISLVTLFLFRLMPGSFKGLLALFSGINFKSTVLDIMIGYLLFAGSLRINSINLKKELGSVVYLASAGVIISTFIIGSLLWLLTYYLHLKLPYADCLIFGAIISPTDAVAVLSVFKTTPLVPAHIKAKVTGEALFNDAVGIILLITLIQIFYSGDAASTMQISINLVKEIIGALIWGGIIGVLISKILKNIDDNELTILITVTASGLGYFIAQHLHVSGVITMVVAGLYIGGHRRENSFSELTSQSLNNFWELADDILNGFMFVLIGLELLTVQFNYLIIILGLASLIIVVIARYISIYLPNLFLGKIAKVKSRLLANRKERILMSWGGVRGGISIALAWSTINTSPLLLSLTYVVVGVTREFGNYCTLRNYLMTHSFYTHVYLLDKLIFS